MPFDNSSRGIDIVVSNAGKTAAGTNVTIGVAVDLTNNRIWYRVAGGGWSNGSGGTSGSPTTNTGGNDITSVAGAAVFPAWSGFNASVSDAITINCGPTFEVAAPSGFSAWDGTGATTWDPANKDASITLSNGNLTATGATAGANAWKSARATGSQSTGKYYFEASVVAVDGSNGWMLGVENGSGTLSSYIGSTANGAGFTSTGAFWRNGGSASGGVSFTKYLGAWRSIRSVNSHNTGKFYAEVSADAIDGTHGWIFGISSASGPLSNYLGSDSNSAGFQSNSFYYAPIAGSAASTLTAGHVLCLAIDLVNKRFWARVDGGSWSGTGGNPATNTGGNDVSTFVTGVPIFTGFSVTDSASTFNQATLNSAGPFTFSVPAGFQAWDGPTPGLLPLWDDQQPPPKAVPPHFAPADHFIPMPPAGPTFVPRPIWDDRPSLPHPLPPHFTPAIDHFYPLPKSAVLTPFWDERPATPRRLVVHFAPVDEFVPRPSPAMVITLTMGWDDRPAAPKTLPPHLSISADFVPPPPAAGTPAGIPQTAVTVISG